MTISISELTNHDLARLFFKKLWQGYDAGGVSMDRSLRARLVEVYLGICEEEVVCDLPVGLKEIAEEAEKRTSTIYRQMVLCGTENASLLPSGLIALLCIEGLHIWYKTHQGEENKDGYIANPLEYRFISSILRIMSIPFFPGLNSDANILTLSQIGMDRVKIKFSAYQP